MMHRAMVRFTGRTEVMQDLHQLRETVKGSKAWPLLLKGRRLEGQAKFYLHKASEVQDEIDSLYRKKHPVIKVALFFKKLGFASLSLGNSFRYLATATLFQARFGPVGSYVKDPENPGKWKLVRYKNPKELAIDNCMREVFIRLHSETDPQKAQWFAEFEQETGKPLTDLEQFVLSPKTWKMKPLEASESQLEF